MQDIISCVLLQVPPSLLWCSFVNVVNHGKGEGAHVAAQRAGKKFFRGTRLPTVMRKNQPLVPRSNFGGKACARTARWFRGQTLPVPGHRGGGGTTQRAQNNVRGPKGALSRDPGGSLRKVHHTMQQPLEYYTKARMVCYLDSYLWDSLGCPTAPVPSRSHGTWPRPIFSTTEVYSYKTP